MSDRPTGNPRGTRSPVLARNGVIATSQPLASAAGLQVLQSGGNAVDAAITAAAVLAVVEPTMTGVGGDVFAIVYDARTKRLRGLNSSGRAGVARQCRRADREGHHDDARGRRLPDYGAGRGRGLGRAPASSTGRITLARALEPAIRYARDGFPGVGDHCRPVGRGALEARSGRRRRLSPGRPGAPAGRDLPQPGPRTDAGADRPRRPRRRVPRADWRGDRRATTRSGAGS